MSRNFLNRGSSSLRRPPSFPSIIPSHLEVPRSLCLANQHQRCHQREPLMVSTKRHIMTRTRPSLAVSGPTQLYRAKKRIVHPASGGSTAGRSSESKKTGGATTGSGSSSATQKEGDGERVFREQFLIKWCDEMGVYLDRSLADVTLSPADSKGFSGRGLYAQKEIPAGELLATIPSTATLRSGDLFYADSNSSSKNNNNTQAQTAMRARERERARGRRSKAMYFTDAAVSAGGPDRLKTGLLSIQRGRAPLSSIADDAADHTEDGKSGGDEKKCPTGYAHHSPEDMAFIHGVVNDESNNKGWEAFSEEERSWWELATVLCLERVLGRTSPFYEYISYCLPQKPVDWATAFFHQREQLFSPSAGLPPDSVARLARISKERDLISFWIARLLKSTVLVAPSDVSGGNGGNLCSSDPSSAASSLSSLNNSSIDVNTQIRLQALATALSSTSLEQLTGWIRWAFEVVTSRANNFVLSVPYTTDTPRPYGVDLSSIFASMSGGGGAPAGVSPNMFSYEGAEATLCPIFDIMNHIASPSSSESSGNSREDMMKMMGGGGGTNVLVTDCLMRPPPRRLSHSCVQDDDPIPCLVLGALGNIPKGNEIGYAYNAPTMGSSSNSSSSSAAASSTERIVAERQKRAEMGSEGRQQIDLIQSLARWGFVPFP